MDMTTAMTIAHVQSSKTFIIYAIDLIYIFKKIHAPYDSEALYMAILFTSKQCCTMVKFR